MTAFESETVKAAVRSAYHDYCTRRVLEIA
jgi:hypothetical protein